MDARSNRVKIQEYLRRGFLNVTHKVFGKERQGEKRLWNNFLVNERAGQTVCIHCWKEFSLIRYAHNDKRLFFQTYPGRSHTFNLFASREAAWSCRSVGRKKEKRSHFCFFGHCNLCFWHFLVSLLQFFHFSEN